MHRHFYPLSSPLASLLCHQHLGAIELQFELSDQERDILAHLGWVGVHWLVCRGRTETRILSYLGLASLMLPNINDSLSYQLGKRIQEM
jgi:hypothetical protein